MIISEKHLHELEKLDKSFLREHSATNDENASSTFHQACHKLQKMIISGQDKFIDNKIWAFSFPEDGCGGFDISQIELKAFKAQENIGAGFMLYAYKTKAEAIDAMRKRILEIENDNQ